MLLKYNPTKKLIPKLNYKNKTIFIFAIILGIIINLLILSIALSKEKYNDNDIVNAIYLAEGGEKAVKPFGILSVKCKDYQECKEICLNTVKNNRKRYIEYGYKKYNTFLEFLASKYAPIGANNDPTNLNKNWLKNVRYFLRQQNE